MADNGLCGVPRLYRCVREITPDLHIEVSQSHWVSSNSTQTVTLVSCLAETLTSGNIHSTKTFHTCTNTQAYLCFTTMP